MTRKRFLTLFIFILLLAACQPETAAVERYGLDSSTSGGEGDFYAEEAPAPQEIGDGFDRETVDNIASDPSLINSNQAQQPEGQERLIIRTGHIDMVVEDAEASLGEIGRLAERLGGWVVSSEVRETSQDAKAGSITLRIPAGQFDEVNNQVKEMALEVTWETTSSQDVTDEYVDLSSRLGNLEATADRVRAFLDDAETVEEALEVNKELSRLEGEIEVIKGRMQYLSQSAAYSTLTVNLTPDAISQPIEVAGWRPEGTAKGAIETLVRTLQGLADIGIVIGLYFLPMALLLGIPGFLLIRMGRNWLRRRSNNVAVETAE